MGGQHSGTSEMNSKDAHEKDLILNMSMRLAAVPGNLTRVHLGKLGKPI